MANDRAVRLAVTINNLTESFPVDQANNPDRWASTMQHVANMTRRAIEGGNAVALEFAVYRNVPTGGQEWLGDFQTLREAQVFAGDNSAGTPQTPEARYVDNVAAVAAEFHGSDTYQTVYDRQADNVSGFTGLWGFCKDAAKAFTDAETAALKAGAEFEWLEAVLDFVPRIYRHEDAKKELPSDADLLVLANEAIAGAKYQPLADTSAAPLEYHGKKEGEPCPGCWTAFTRFVRDDSRSEDDQAEHPATEAQRTILICACTEAEELEYWGESLDGKGVAA